MYLFKIKKPYELGLKVNGKLECVYEFLSVKDRENFERQTMPLQKGEEYERHDILF